MPVVHAPAAGIVPSSLCQEPTGDVTTASKTSRAPTAARNSKRCPLPFSPSSRANLSNCAQRIHPEQRCAPTPPIRKMPVMRDVATRAKLGIGYASLVSKRIFIGRVNKAQNAFLDGKEDHTEAAVFAVAEFIDEVHNGDMQLIHPRTRKTYRLRVDRIDIEQSTTLPDPS